MTTLFIDFETRSRCNLKSHGAYIYAKDPSTEVLCMSFAFDDGELETWTGAGLAPANIMRLTSEADRIVAHNAAFERLILKEVLGCYIPLEVFYCTAAQARANCMPGRLEDVGRFAGLGMRKDYRGAQLIRALSMPRPDGTFREDAELMQEMIKYCEQDVRVTRELYKATRQLTEQELHDYHVNERINDLGVRIDVPLCESAMDFSEEERQEIEALVRDITKGEVPTVRSGNMREWVYKRLGPEGKRLMESYENGEKKISINKAVRANLLDLANENPDEVPAEVADVVQCADDLWSSSVAKFKRMIALTDADDRARGAFVFAGGVATGRAASYGIQVHNLPRQCAKNPEEVRADMVEGYEIVPEHGPTVGAVLKSMLRPALIPKDGHVFVVADWSAIEGRVNPWLAKSEAGEQKLDQYRDKLDPYIVNAAAMYGVPYSEILKGKEAKIEKYVDMRQCGKVQELALSYGGKAGSFSKFASVYNIRMSDDEIGRAIRVWTKHNPWMSEHGDSLDTAMWSAMRHPGREFYGPRVTYMFDGTHLWYALPSGRILCYSFAKIENGSVTYRKASWKPAATAKEWPRGRLWYGELLNNCTQATAHDLLRHAMRELDDLYYRIVLHVHDEIVVEVPEDDADQCIKDMTEIMTTPPSWAIGLPLEIDIKTHRRYGK